MARKRQSYIKCTFTHRCTEADDMAALLDGVPLSIKDYVREYFSSLDPSN